MDKHYMDKCISGLRTVKIVINNVPFQDNPRSCGFIHWLFVFPVNTFTYCLSEKNNKNFWHPDSKLLGTKILMAKNHHTHQAEVSTAKAIT